MKCREMIVCRRRVVLRVSASVYVRWTQSRAGDGSWVKRVKWIWTGHVGHGSQSVDPLVFQVMSYFSTICRLFSLLGRFNARTSHHYSTTEH